MEIVTKKSKQLKGEVSIPADKSITHRAVMISSVAKGTSVVENYLPAEDCLSTIEAFIKLGVNISVYPKHLVIEGNGLNGLNKPDGPIYAGNSGTTVRLMSGLLCGCPFRVRIEGDESLSKRPMKRIIEPLSLMGASFSAREGNFLPMEITGTENLKPLNYTGKIASAQVKSSILFAGLHAKGVTCVSEPSKSRDHTERMFKSYGVKLNQKGLKVCLKGPCEPKAGFIKIPADISAASFFLIAGSIVPDSDIIMRNIGVNPTRDGILQVLKLMGADIKITNKQSVMGEPVCDLRVKTSRLRAIDIGGDLIVKLIDEIPVIALLMTQAKGNSVIRDAAELRVKESDRLKSITCELNKMGAGIIEKPDGLVIKGPVSLSGAKVECYNDHRIAMTLAIAGKIATSKTVVSGADCINTSFPNFAGELENISF